MSCPSARISLYGSPPTCGGAGAGPVFRPAQDLSDRPRPFLDKDQMRRRSNSLFPFSTQGDDQSAQCLRRSVHLDRITR